MELKWTEVLVLWMFGGGWASWLFWLSFVGIPAMFGIAAIVEHILGKEW